jgi:hypothetical protein
VEPLIGIEPIHLILTWTRTADVLEGQIWCSDR